ncbi:MAG: protein translocase subunit SecD [Candidatus Andersenbacteria bacterium]
MRFLHKNFITLAALLILTALATWISIPQHPSLKIGQFERDLNVKLGLDLQGGSHLIYRANITGISEADVTEALAGVRDVIERRVNAFGVSEPVVQTNRVREEYRVIVELAGVHDPNQAIALIGETPQLDFRREVGEEEALEQFNIDNPEAITGPIFERTALTGKSLERATISFDPVSGQPQVNLEFDAEGSELFAELTRQNIQKRLAIYLDGVPISAPVVQSEITNGRAVISGGFTLEEAKELAQRLNAGALPVPIELIGQQTIGPSLGRLSINQSIVAGVMGMMAVILWMIIFYRLPGLVASIALIIYALFFMAIIKLLPITLTLAGVAGFILSIGMAVDANVLIFERFRENLRLGRSMRYALDNGFEEAWGSIWASNITSLLSALILYFFGTSIIRGFALTLAIGIILSMFTAVTLTRTLLNLMLHAPRTHTAALLSVRPQAARPTL